MAADILTIILACALLICPGIAPVYDSAGFDTAEIIQTAEEISGAPLLIDTQNPASETKNPAQTPKQETEPAATPYPKQTQNPDKPSAELTQNPHQLTPAPAQTPSAEPAPAQTPSAEPAAAAPDKAGATLIAGNWYGTKSLFFGMASAEFYLTADTKGNMKISGTANAPSAGYTNEPFSVNADWTYLGGDSFTGTTDDKEISFTCNGNQILLTANPYALGLIESSIANMDIDIVMKRI